MSTLRAAILLTVMAAAWCQAGPDLALAPDQEVADWVRTRIQAPLRVHCGECHGGGQRKGGFRIDTHALLLGGGEDYPVSIRPWQPERSPLLDMIRWEGDEDLNMPPKQRLPPEVVADIARWIAMGAPWPVDEAPKAEEAPTTEPDPAP